MEKLMAALRSAWAYVLVFKNWLKSWTFSVNGFQAVVAGVLVGILLTVAYWNGRLSHREVGRMLGFAMPAADFAQPVAVDQVLLDQCTKTAWAWRDRAVQAETDLALSKGDASTVKTAANLPKPECKAQVRYVKVCPKQSTVLEDLGLQ